MQINKENIRFVIFSWIFTQYRLFFEKYIFNYIKWFFNFCDILVK